MANVFAQTEAPAFGKTPEEVKAEGTPMLVLPASRATVHPIRLLAERLTRKSSANSSLFTNTRFHAGDDLEY